MGLLDQCSCAYVNLDHRLDRKIRMERSLEEAGIKAHRVRGMLPDEYKGDPKKVEVMRNRTPGAIGCHMSQVSIMENALCLSKHAFVMEDDLVFCKDFQKRISMMEQFIATNDWDILWLGGTFHVNPPYWHKKLGDARCTEDPHMMRTFGAFCTYAYIVNKHSLARVLSLLEQQLPTSIGIDYAMIQIQPQLHTFAFVPGCVIQYDHESDIGKGMTIFSNFKKLGPYWYQERLENFDPKTFNWHEAKLK